MKKILDISPYFELRDGKWIFIGKELELFIPAVYQDRGLFDFGSTASSLGVFQLRINNSYTANLLLLAKIEIEFESDRVVEEEGYSYIVLNILPGQAFICNTELVKNPNLLYTIFMTFIALGKIPPYLDYDAVQSIFDNDKLVCGVSLNVNHSIWEMIYAHMHRDMKDPYKLYRYSAMTDKPQIVSLHAISHLPGSITSRIVGSFMSDGVVSSLVDTNVKESNIVENLLR